MGQTETTSPRTLCRGFMVEELLRSKQVVGGLAIFGVGAIWLLLPELDIIEATSGANMIALVMAMLGAMVVFLGVSVTGSGAEKVSGMDEIFEVQKSLEEMQGQLAELIGAQEDDD